MTSLSPYVYAMVIKTEKIYFLWLKCDGVHKAGNDIYIGRPKYLCSNETFCPLLFASCWLGLSNEDGRLTGAALCARVCAYISINYRCQWTRCVFVDQTQPGWRHLSSVFSSRRRFDLNIRRPAARSTRDRPSPDIRSSRLKRPSNRPNTSPDQNAPDSPMRSACPKAKWRYIVHTRTHSPNTQCTPFQSPICSVA